MRAIRFLLLAVLLAARLGAGEASAQELRGQVTIVASAGRPVEGALVGFVGEDAMVRWVLTDGAGFFLLRAPAPGIYRVRIERIGFETWTSDPLDLGPGQSLAMDFEIPIRPVRLAAMDVSIRRQCIDDPREAPEIETVWDEARKALAAAQIAQRSQLFRFRSLLFDRRVSERRLALVSVETSAAVGVVETPFQSLPAARLSEAGYIQQEGETIYYYGPDADVLLSQSFLDDHCFGLERSETARRSLIGLTFEPKKDRELSDISGVMWIDEGTAELQRVEFEYERIPQRGVDDKRIGGRIEFVRLPGGAFAVSNWFLRMPALARIDSRVLSRLGLGRMDEPYEIQAFTETGGELRELFDTSGSAIEWTRGGVVHGVVTNSLTGQPLSNATLTLDRPTGDDLVGHTGPDGTFLFDDLSAGRFEISFQHLSLEALRWDPPTQTFTLADDDVMTVSFALPDPGRVQEDECRRDDPGGVILGRVTAGPDLLPVRSVRIWAEWPASQATRDATGSPTVAGEVARTNRNGLYKLCAIPLRTDISVFLEGANDLATGKRVRLERPAAVVSFRLPR